MSADTDQQKDVFRSATHGACVRPSGIAGVATDIRASLRAVEVETRNMMSHAAFKSEQSYESQHGEMKAQIMLAVRHLEDARMRLGKVCQYACDGVSIYDKA